MLKDSGIAYSNCRLPSVSKSLRRPWAMLMILAGDEIRAAIYVCAGVRFNLFQVTGWSRTSSGIWQAYLEWSFAVAVTIVRPDFPEAGDSSEVAGRNGWGLTARTVYGPQFGDTEAFGGR